ncbi:hypothetical protein PPYR_00218 [Photinus pyralis]|uniref:PiggyBac transposable element-derived protein domain-containing protein n=1 Tax=Photinus pyralis TaxID=7054 RepID=A0A5N4B155_PHOPY|nr:hypothetical protein PPYR_00218 [Photinus pyralis]
MSYYEKEQRHLLELWNELEEEVVGGSDDEEDVQEDFGETSNHESEFELSEDEELSEQNIKSGLLLYFPDSVLEKIVECTNRYIAKIRPRYSRARDAADTDVVEIKAVLGLLYLAGVQRSSHINLRDLWMQAPISGTGRNVTCDNWFTSIPLALELLQKHNLTLVGTLRKNKREIPEFFSAKIKERRINTSMFGFTKDMTLVSYKPKQNKIVLLLSTMHYADEIDQETGDACKPAMITFYNSTKGGVDELKGNYSVSRKSSRWPLTIFFSMLNIAGINSQII